MFIITFLVPSSSPDNVSYICSWYSVLLQAELNPGHSATGRIRYIFIIETQTERSNYKFLLFLEHYKFNVYYVPFRKSLPLPS
jgi:hypothetical protein